MATAGKGREPPDTIKKATKRQEGMAVFLKKLYLCPNGIRIIAHYYILYCIEILHSEYDFST